MTIHMYTFKRGYPWGSDKAPEYKLLCTGKWVAAEKKMETYGYHREHFVTQPWNSTCLHCLNLTIPKLEQKLSVMTQRREKLMAEEISNEKSS